MGGAVFKCVYFFYFFLWEWESSCMLNLNKKMESMKGELEDWKGEEGDGWHGRVERCRRRPC